MACRSQSDTILACLEYADTVRGGGAGGAETHLHCHSLIPSVMVQKIVFRFHKLIPCVVVQKLIKVRASGSICVGKQRVV